MRNIDWYFDFVSPFAYLQSRRLSEFPADVRIVRRPVLFAGLLEHWKHKGPAEIAAKRRFTYRHVVWLARRLGVPLRFPPAHPFNPLHALRLAIALDARASVIDAIFRFIWAQGRDVAAEWPALCDELGIVDAESLIEAAGAKRLLRENGRAALAAGVFGVPTLVVDGELFWGLDATDMALDYLREPSLLAGAEYARVDALPVSASRKDPA
jgi:2-hydroxychromene-2-carboxylate isomerase